MNPTNNTRPEPMSVTAQRLVGYKPAMREFASKMAETGASQGQLVFNVYPDGSVAFHPQGALNGDFFLVCAQMCIQLAREHSKREARSFAMAPASPLKV